MIKKMELSELDPREDWAVRRRMAKQVGRALDEQLECIAVWKYWQVVKYVREGLG